MLGYGNVFKVLVHEVLIGQITKNNSVGKWSDLKIVSVLVCSSVRMLDCQSVEFEECKSENLEECKIGARLEECKIGRF